MCGIAGLFSKSLDVSERLGSHLGDMLLQLSDRGPDSAGVAVYRDPAPSGSSKVSLFSPDPAQDWDAVRAAQGGGRALHRGRRVPLLVLLAAHRQVRASLHPVRHAGHLLRNALTAPSLGAAVDPEARRGASISAVLKTGAAPPGLC